MLSVRSLLVVIVVQFGVIAYLLLRSAHVASAETQDPRVAVLAESGNSTAQAQGRGEKTPAPGPDAHGTEQTRRLSRAGQLQREERDLYLGKVEDPAAAPFRLLGLGNKDVPTAALVFAGLTEKDRPALENAVRKLWDTMDQGLAARAVLDQNAAAEGKVVFTIPADDVGGNAAIASFRDEMSAQFGAETAEKLLKGLHHRAYFGSFGRANVRIELSEAPGPGGGNQTMINYRTTDPETGDLIGGNGGPLGEYFSQSMGKATYEKILAAKAAISGAK